MTKKISALPAASAAADANQFEINEAGTSKRVTLAQMRTQLTAGLPSFRARMSADLTGVGSNTDAKLPFNTEDSDVGGLYDAVTNYRWVPGAGRIIISASAYIASGQTAANACSLRLFKNGAIWRFGQVVFAAAGGAAGISVVGQDIAADNDYYECYFRGITASTLTVDKSTGLTYFEGTRV